MLLQSNRAAVSRVEPQYPETPPFHPSQLYPEYPFAGESEALSPTANYAYEGVRAALRLLALDAARFDTHQWNPLGEIIRPGQTVLLKPNFLRDSHELGRPTQSLTTDGSIIRAVLDYVCIALDRQGRVLIADSPQNDAVFKKIVSRAGLDAIRQFYARHTGISIEVYDLRTDHVHKVQGVLVKHEKLPGDPLGYTAIDLGTDSMFEPVARRSRKFRGAEYSLAEIRRHHGPGKHEYPVCRTVLQADAVINLPKLKTHRKAGVALSLENMIGINGNKNWLPHHTEGVPLWGGDQFNTSGWKNRVEHRVVRLFKRFFPMLGPLKRHIAAPAKRTGTRVFGDTTAGRVRSGNWWGNDTIWRTSVDLMRVLLYSDKNGMMCDEPQRSHLTLIDGLIGGEGNGPHAPDDKPCGLVIAALNPVVADAVATRLMGFDQRIVPVVGKALGPMRWPIATMRHAEIESVSDVEYWSGRLEQVAADRLNFNPHFGWAGHIRIGDPVIPSPVNR
jgi:uncharacterized protein (DUF362 family)